MRSEPPPDQPQEEQAGDSTRSVVDASGAMGVMVGDDNTQIIYSYNRLTWTDGVAPPPLVGVSGAIDSPYRGLGAFEERDGPFFFGREAAATEVLERMSQCADRPGLLVVSGVSGVGKSSLLQAGVLSRLRGAGLASLPGAQSWHCLVFTPGHAPLDELALQVASLAGTDAAAVRKSVAADPAGFALTARQAALAQPTALAGAQQGRADRRRRLLMVVDQFEQLFTRCPHEEQRQAFITALHAAATAGYGPDRVPAALVVLGVRADFEARCAAYPQLADAVQQRYLVMPMTRRQLLMAITEPVKKVGSRVDDDLASLLLQEVANREPAESTAVLPFLSHALDQAWRNRTGGILGIEDYERTGGIEGAVASSAQRAYDGLTPGQQAAARQVFTRLTAATSDGTDTASRATRGELIAGKSQAQARDVEAALEAFAAERLLTLAADTAEISHEVLLTAWPLLHDIWLAETRADRIVRTQLRNTASDWTRHGRDAAYLYGGSLLETATGTAARITAEPARHPALSPAERDFLKASDRARRRRARRLQGFTALLAAMVIGLAFVAALAFSARQDAVLQRDTAISDELVSSSEALGDSDPRLGRLLSVAAWHLNPSNDARYAMLSAAALPGISILRGHTNGVESVAFSPDGKTLASGSLDDTIRLWNVATGQLVGKPLIARSLGVNSVAFSPDGKTLASGGDDGTIRLWNPTTGRPVGSPLTAGQADLVKSVAFSPDGKLLASGGEDGTVRLWNVSTGRLVDSLRTGNALTVESVAFSPDGKTLASGGIDDMVRLWDVATGRPAGRTIAAHAGAVNAVAFSPVGKILASGGFDGTVRLWNPVTGRPVGSLLTSQANAVLSVAFSPDGKTLASGSDDGTVRLWEVRDGQPVGSPLTGHTSTVDSVAFSPDGKSLASGSDDGTIRLWNAATGRPIGNPLGSHDGKVSSVVFSPGGKTLASDIDDAVRLGNVAAGIPIRSPVTGAAGVVKSVAFSPDGKTLATGGFDGTVRLWDVATGRLVGRSITARVGQVLSVAFSPDGKMLAIANSGAETGQDTITLWDVAAGRPIGSALVGQKGEIISVAFSPDGKTLASGSNDGTVRLWDVAAGQLIGSLPTGGIQSVAFSPDGKALATGGEDGTVRLWDVATRRLIGSPLTGHTGAVDSVAFSPDGKTLASGSTDTTVRLWDVAYTTDVAAHLCASEGSWLTPAEWTRWVPPGPAYQNRCLLSSAA